MYTLLFCMCYTPVEEMTYASGWQQDEEMDSLAFCKHILHGAIIYYDVN